MCGLNGIFAYSSAASTPKEAELLATRDAMTVRGPDGAGTWWSEGHRCGMGHRRLSILDLSDRAAQPMISEDRRLIVVFNGEIYNYPELRAELEDDGVHFRTSSDTEVLLHLYARDGKGMVNRLRGMFAFVIWDDIQRGLFLARDPYGIKPLYTTNDGWTFRFASQVKALISAGQISRDPEPAGIVGFHLFGSVPEPFTLYREIRALPAGHTQWVDEAGPREPQPFANIAAVLSDGAQKSAALQEIEESVRASVLQSVRKHLLADVEVGIFLSAGVDSGAILGLMQDAGQHEIRAITLAFEEFRHTSEDEVPLAARVAEHYGACHNVRCVSEQELHQDLPRIFEAMDQPSIDGINTWFISKAAKEVGLKVAISGLGGDELLAGYPSFSEIPRWHRRFGPLAAVPGLGRLSRGLIRAFLPDLVRQKPKALGLLQYADSWPGTYLLRRGLFLPYELTQLIGPDFVREGLRRLRLFERFAVTLTPNPGNDNSRVCALESSHYLRNQLLRDADWAGMAHSLEIRVPLVDWPLLGQLAPVIPALRPGVGKAALARSPSSPLPDEVLAREKSGFGIPMGSWMNSRRGSFGQATGEVLKVKGLESREWSRMVLKALSNGKYEGLAAT